MPFLRHTKSSLESLEGRVLLAAGQLDPSFGDGGVVTFDPTPLRENISLFARTPDGKLLIAGEGSGAEDVPYVKRLNANGSPDASFGPGGTKSIALPDGAFAVDPTSGDVLIASRGGGEVTRYNPDFTIDTSFGGGDGKLALAGVTIQVIRLSSDEKIVIAGTAQGDAVLVYRFNANGTPDTSFDGDGKAVIEETFGELSPHEVDAVSLADLEVAGDGSMFVAVHDEFHRADQDFGDVDIVNLLVYKLTEAGDVDSEFAGGESARINSGNFSDEPNTRDLDLASDGTLLVLWTTPFQTDFTSYWMSRVSTTGVVETLPPLSLPVHASLGSLSLDSEGRIIGVGSAYNEAGDNGALFATRFLPDGSVDSIYGTFGVFVGELTDFGGRAIVTPQGEVFEVRPYGGGRFTSENTTLGVIKIQGGEGAPPDLAINADRELVVTTTQARDTVRVHRRRDGRIVVRVNDFARSFPGTRAKRIVINALGGSDSVTILGDLPEAHVDGGDGFDTIVGGDGDDVLLGGGGRDRISGGAGNDLIKGGGGNDYLLGNSGGDTILGQGGRDRVRGAGGNDNLFGGAGDDFLDGSVGNDRSANDPLDTRNEIEMLL
jgi:uncharacterized delta-60 repeat protein